MREFAPLGAEGLAEALQSSASLEVDETKTKVRRRTEVTEPKGQFERSIYAVSPRNFDRMTTTASVMDYPLHLSYLCSSGNAGMELVARQLFIKVLHLCHQTRRL